MDLNKSNPKAEAEAEAEEAETAKIDPSDLVEDVRDVSNWKGLETSSSSEKEGNGDETNKAILSLSVEDKTNGEETEKSILFLSEAAKKIDPSPLASFLKEVLDEDWYQPAKQIMKLIDYYGIQFSLVPSFQWVKMFEEYPLSKLIHVPLSLIPIPVYEKSIDFINTLPFHILPAVVLWVSDLILTEWPGVVKIEQLNSDKSKVAAFVVLAMVLRTKPDALIHVLPNLREIPTYQGHDKLPVIIWMIAQASQGDLSAGLYSWVRNLLPLVSNNKCYSSQSIHLILQSVEMILSSNPKARVLLFLNGNVRNREVLIPPGSFETLVRLTFPPPSARVEGATERFEAIYPLLKEVALAPGSNAVRHIFTFSLKLAGGQGNPALANEATAIAISVLTQNVCCFTQWEILYKENLEASVLLLEKLVDEWKDHCLKLSPCSDDARTVKHAMYSFTMENEKAITEGVANLSLYKEADKWCKLILRRLHSRGSDRLGIGSLTSMFIAAAGGIVGAALTLYISCK